MSSLPSYKDIVSLIKKGATIEAQEQVMILREAALDLQEQNIALREEISGLKTKLDLSIKMEFRKPFYYQQEDPHPYCPKCWETQSLSVHVCGPFSARGTRAYHRCPECDKKFYI